MLPFPLLTESGPSAASALAKDTGTPEDKALFQSILKHLSSLPRLGTPSAEQSAAVEPTETSQAKAVDSEVDAGDAIPSAEGPEEELSHGTSTTHPKADSETDLLLAAAPWRDQFSTKIGAAEPQGDGKDNTSPDTRPAEITLPKEVSGIEPDAPVKTAAPAGNAPLRQVGNASGSEEARGNPAIIGQEAPRLPPPPQTGPIAPPDTGVAPQAAASDMPGARRSTVRQSATSGELTRPEGASAVDLPRKNPARSTAETVQMPAQNRFEDAGSEEVVGKASTQRAGIDEQASRQGRGLTGGSLPQTARLSERVNQGPAMQSQHQTNEVAQAPEGFLKRSEPTSIGDLAAALVSQVRSSSSETLDAGPIASSAPASAPAASPGASRPDAIETVRALPMALHASHHLAGSNGDGTTTALPPTRNEKTSDPAPRNSKEIASFPPAQPVIGASGSPITDLELANSAGTASTRAVQPQAATLGVGPVPTGIEPRSIKPGTDARPVTTASHLDAPDTTVPIPTSEAGARDGQSRRTLPALQETIRRGEGIVQHNPRARAPLTFGTPVSIDPSQDFSAARDALSPQGGVDRTTLPELRPTVLNRIHTLINELKQQDQSATVTSRSIANAERQTEIDLAPAELGKLKITLQSSEKGVHVQISAERPETLELVRRHLDGLHRSLLSDGVKLDGYNLGNLDGRTGQGPTQSQPGRSSLLGASGEDTDNPRLSHDSAEEPHASTAGRLDIRI